jgi:hypothetical protein
MGIMRLLNSKLEVSKMLKVTMEVKGQPDQVLEDEDEYSMRRRISAIVTSLGAHRNHFGVIWKGGEVIGVIRTSHIGLL